MDLSSATFTDDTSRIQIVAAPPSVAEVVFKMNKAQSMLEESLGGDWTLNASKTANVIMMRDEGANATTRGADRQAKWAARCGQLGGTTSRTLFESKWKYYSRNWKESCSGAKRMETMRQVLEGKGAEESKTAHVHLLRARCGTGVGTKTLRSPGSRAARDVEEPVGRDCSSNVERNQTEESKTCLPLLGSVADC